MKRVLCVVQKKFMICSIVSMTTIMTNAATFEWSFAVVNSQNGVAPVSVTAYLYLDVAWVGNDSFNIDTLILTDHIFGEEHSPVVGFPVIALSLLVEPVSETVSQLIISWSTHSGLDTPTGSAMNQYWTIVFVDDATPDRVGFMGAAFDDLVGTTPFSRDNQYQQWDWYSLYSANPVLDVGQFRSVPEPSTALLAIVGLAALGLRRRKVT